MRILLIEDNPADAKLVLHTIKRIELDAEIRWVEGAEMLPNYLDQYHATPDLILCDMLHPGNGDRAIQMLKHAYPDTWLAVITIADKETQGRALMLGADEVIVKGFDHRKFKGDLERLLRQVRYETQI